MDFARFRPRVTVLLTLGAVALAALLAGGCSAPDSDERARFGVVTGVVVDASNTPIAGASVTVADPLSPAPPLGTVLGTRNFFGVRGPYVTDASGRFAIPGVKVSDTESGLTVLNLVAAAPGFLPAFATVPAPRSTTILGKAFVQGAETRDIVVQQEVTTGVVARLTRPGDAVAIGAAGTGSTPLIIAITDPVTGISLGNATLVIPQGALTQTAEFVITGLSGTGLASVAAAPPASIPTANVPAAPAANVVAGAGTVSVTVPLAGLDLRALSGQTITFIAGKPATVTVPAPAGLSVTAANLGIVRFNEASGLWELVPNANIVVSGGVITFQIPSTGTFAVLTQATWQFGSASPTGQSVKFPPVAEAPNGYIVSGRINQNLTFTPSTAQDTLRTAFSALTGQPATGAVLVVVEPGTTIGRLATEVSFPVTVTIGTQTFVGTRTTWVLSDLVIPQEPTFPSHIQGHVQGGATGG